MTNEEAKDILQSLKFIADDYSDSIEEAIDMAIKALETSAWIPVGERLPGENGLYLVTSNKWGDWEVFAEIFYDGEWVKAEPVAWKPLPEPYKGGEDE